MSVVKQDGIWIFAEQRDGGLHTVGLELLSKAGELAEGAGASVTAVLLGSGVEPLAQVLVDHGADRVFVADDPLLKHYRVLPYASVLESMVRERGPSILLMGATAMGVELAPRVAARLQTGLSAHCIDLKLDEDGRLLQVVPGWEGGVVATIKCPDRLPQMATVMPGIMRARPPEHRNGNITRVAVDLAGVNLGPEILEVSMEPPKGVPLEKAEVVVAGGWGIGGKEDWKMIEELAEVLNGAVGATRPAVDEGWAHEDCMIGQSGKTVRPALYIGIGISGVMHHIVGMDQSKNVIGINTDPSAEIFAVSDVIVVEDFRKIVPKLIEAIRARRSTGYRALECTDPGLSAT